VLRQRILTALIIAPVVLVTLVVLPPVATWILLSALVLMGAWEWTAFPRFQDGRLRVLYLIAIALAMAASWHFSGSDSGLQVLLYVAAGWWLVAFVWITTYPKATALLAILAGFLILVPAWTALARLSLAHEHGRLLVLLLLLLVIAADVGAYFAGRHLGRLKLAPKVSPGKTWEGVLGGLATATLVALIASWSLDVRTGPFLALCAGVVIASVVGDLTESMFKRYAGLKDSGSFFPGHGGVLDRIDSITAAAPFFVLGLGWLGVLR
jgi:phosphatidate cytidylyltransferase